MPASEVDFAEMTDRNAVSRTVGGILAQIEKGRIAAGASLTEIELGERLGVARSTVREALGRLESRGIVVRARGRGLVVRRLDRKDVTDLYDLREHLEGLAARRAAERQKAEQVLSRSALTEERRRWRKVLKEKALPAFSEANRAFHQLIIECAGNRHLPDMLDRTLMILFTAQFRGWLAPPEVGQAADEHLQILAAIEAGDGNAAERAMRHHVRSSAALILNLPADVFE